MHGSNAHASLAKILKFSHITIIHYLLVLSKGFDMDNAEELRFLESRTGKQAIIDLHVEGIIEYFLQFRSAHPRSR